MYFYVIPLNLCPSASISLFLYLRHTHAPARRVQVCDRLGVLGVGHPLSVSPSAPSSKLALVQGQASTSICLVNTEISQAHPSPWQKIAQARPARAKIACYAESAERIYLPKTRPRTWMRYFKILEGVRGDGQTMEEWRDWRRKANERWKPPPAASKMSMEPRGCID